MLLLDKRISDGENALPARRLVAAILRGVTERASKTRLSPKPTGDGVALRLYRTIL